MTTSKPRILLVADRPNWAYHHIANFIIEALGKEFDFSLDFLAFNKRPEFDVRKVSSWDRAKRETVLRWNAFRYRRTRSDGRYDLILLLGFYFDTVGMFRATAPRLVKGIYTQGFPPQGMDFDHLNKVSPNSLSRERFRELYLANADAIVCGAPVIAQDYRDLHPRVRCANMAYDEDQFSPVGHRPSPADRLVVGWTGNPDREFKGFRTHIVPAVERAARERSGIVLKTRFEGPLSTLHEFYKDVDVVAIASEADAGPSMYMEAALSGVPAISNRIGIPLSVIRHNENGVFVERDVDELANAMIRLHDDRELLRKMSVRVRADYLKDFGCIAQAENWRRLLPNCYESLFVCREPFPTKRVDVATLFGKYLPQHGVASDLVSIETSSGSAASSSWAAGRTLIAAATSSRARNAIRNFVHGARTLLGVRPGEYDAIVVRDNPALCAVAIWASRRAALPSIYWMSFPIAEGNLLLAKSGWRKLGLARWAFAWLKGAVGKWLLYGYVLPRASHAFVQSDFMARSLEARGIESGKLTPVPMGVDLEEIRSPAVQPVSDARLDGKVPIVYIGTFDAARQLDVMIEALPIARKSIDNLMLVMVGDANISAEADRLKALARRLGVEDSILWTGWLPMAKAWGYALRAKVGLSFIPRGELYDVSSPTKVVEYLALGIPALVNDLPDQVMVAERSKAAAVEAMSPQGIADGIASLLQDKRRWQRMSEAGPEYVAQERSYEVIARSVALRLQRVVDTYDGRRERR